MARIELPRLMVSMLGSSGVGKTAYIAALFKCFNSYRYEYKYEDQKRSILISRTWASNSIADAILANQNANLRPDETTGFPIGTGKGHEENERSPMIEYDLLLSVESTMENDTFICPVRLNDYRGGLQKDTDLAENDREIIDVWEDTLCSSDVIIVPIDGIFLYKYCVTKEAKYMDKIGSASTCALFRQLNASSLADKPLCVILLITKTDSNIIDSSYTADKCKKLIDAAKNVFSSIVNICDTRCQQHRWQYGIIPVGVTGKDNCEQVWNDALGIVDKTMRVHDYTAENISESFLFGLYYSANNRRKKLDEEIGLSTTDDGSVVGFDAFKKGKSVADRWLWGKDIKQEYQDFLAEVKRKKEERDHYKKVLDIFNLPVDQTGTSFIKTQEEKFDQIMAPFD